jgi:VWFA-related protein
MRRLAVILLLVCLPSSIPNQQHEARLRVDVRLVLLNTQVSRPDGSTVADLKREEFRVYEDNEEKPISVFATMEDPVYVALVIDTSGSTRAHLEMLKKAAEGFVRYFGPEDNLAVYDIGPEVMRVLAFTNNHATVMDVIERLQTSESASASRRIRGADRMLNHTGGTLLYDGLPAVEDDFPALAQRRTILVFTDTIDVGSSTRFDEFRYHILRVGAPMYAVTPVSWDSPTGGEATDTDRKTWGIILNGNASSEDAARQREITLRLLDHLSSRARVWLAVKQSGLKLIAPDTEVAASKPRPLSPSEARRALAEGSLWQGPPQRSELRINVKLDRALLFSDADHRSAAALAEGLRLWPGTYTVVAPELLPRPEDQDRVIQALMRGRMGPWAAESVMMFEEFRTLVADTGGLAVEIKTADELEAQYVHLAQLIRSSYTLGYYTKAKPGRHELRVQVTDPKLEVRSRRVLIVEE